MDTSQNPRTAFLVHWKKYFPAVPQHSEALLRPDKALDPKTKQAHCHLPYITLRQKLLAHN